MPSEQGALLRNAGFVSGPKGSLVKGRYRVYLPGDTRSGKFEMTYEVPKVVRTDFPATPERGVLRQVRDHEKVLR